MRMLWAKANEGSVPDLELAKQACAVAAQCAPYCHPRLAAVEARVGMAAQVETISAEERCRRAREEIDRAFAEYPREPEAEARRIEQRSDVIEEYDQGQPAAKINSSPVPVPRQFAREGELEAAPSARLPTRYRVPRDIGNWSG